MSRTLVPRYNARRPERPTDPTLLDAPEFCEEGEGIELDLMRRIYNNLAYECSDLELLVAHIRTSNAPFTGRDLENLDQAISIIRSGLKQVKKVTKHERRWSVAGTLER